MRVFITGASGFIGRALAARYADDGHEVCGVDLIPDPARGVVAGDVAVRGPWQDEARGCDLVLHTAAVVSLRLERPDEVWRANVGGTLHALEAAERAGARLVHLSSVTVFGFDFDDGVDERAPVKPTGLPYPDTKIASEQVVLQAQLEGRVDATIIRPGDVYGPRSRAWAVLPAQLIEQRRFVLPDGGRGIFSPVYIDNLVDGIVLAAAAPEAVGQVFTLSDGVGIANHEFFAPYAELVGRRLLTAPMPVVVAAASVVQRAARLRPGDRTRGPALPAENVWGVRRQGTPSDINPASVRYMLRRGTYSNAKARRVLGWEPAVGVPDGLARTVEWLRLTRDA